MGVAYAAEHIGLGRQVAIKIMRTEHVEPTLLARFVARRSSRESARISRRQIYLSQAAMAWLC